jgi:hypothetical protein
MSGRIDLINADMLSAQLLSIPQKIRDTVERKALTEINKLVVRTLASNVPSETGALKRSLGSQIRKFKDGNVMFGLVGPDYDYVGNVGRNESGKKTFIRFKD